MSVVCLICNQRFSSNYKLARHLQILHNISSKDYYDKYIGVGVCKICNKPTRFVSISKGYKHTCSPHCAAIYSRTKREQTCLEKYGTVNPAQNNQVKQKISSTVKSVKCQKQTKQTNLNKYGVAHVMQDTNIVNKAIATSIRNNSYSTGSQKSHASRSIESKQFEKDYNCTSIGKLISQYGQGWLSIKDKLELLHYKGYTYIQNEQLDLIQNYYTQQSKPELTLFDFVKNLCKDAIHKNRQIIKPYELDIYIPSLKLGIEYNGSYWHSIEAGMSKDYHLKKSLMCRSKGIRLIHIYEFEDFEEQKQLIKNLILGQDNYPNNDFNKNNLITQIPQPTIYVTKRGYHVYTAGKLKEEL